MRDLFRLIGWTVVDLFRSRAALESPLPALPSVSIRPSDRSRLLPPGRRSRSVVIGVRRRPIQPHRFLFDADNPSRWAFHCHNLYHMMTGMMTEVRYPAII
jgi:hypothetical protein